MTSAVPFFNKSHRFLQLFSQTKPSMPQISIPFIIAVRLEGYTALVVRPSTQNSTFSIPPPYLISPFPLVFNHCNDHPSIPPRPPGFADLKTHKFPTQEFFFLICLNVTRFVFDKTIQYSLLVPQHTVPPFFFRFFPLSKPIPSFPEDLFRSSSPGIYLVILYFYLLHR